MNRIKECRKKRDIIQTDLAARLGLTQSGLSLWENGKADPGQEGWLKLSEILDVSTDYLMGNSDIPNAESLQLFAEPAEKNQPPKLETEDARVAEFYEILGRLSSNGIDKALDIMRMVELSDKPNKP